MRVKYLIATASLAVMTAVVVAPGVSNANRGTSPSVEPTVQPVDEAPADPVAEAPAPSVEEETPAAPVVEEAPAEPTTTTTTAAPVKTAPVVEEPAAPAPKPAPQPPTVVTIEPKAAPAPAPAAQPDNGNNKGACHMDSYKETSVASLQGGERTRAEKVDRNGDGTVCRKDIPGRGHGNTGQGSNIKDN
jgi:outer membrane biosynthesis protein TonB